MLQVLVEINLIRPPPHILILIWNYFRDSLCSNVQCRMIPLQLDQLLGLVRDLAQPAGHLVEVLANLPASARWWWWWWWQQSKFFFEDGCLLKIVHLFHVLFSSSWYLIRPSRRSSVLILRCDKSLKRAWTVNNPCFQLDYLKKIWEMEPCEHLLVQFLAVKPKQVQNHFLMFI